MITDIYGNQTVYGGTFRISDSGLLFTATSANGQQDAGGSSLGVMAQGVQAGYAQQSSRIWDLEDGRRTYFFVGRAQGVLDVARIVAPASISDQFISTFSNTCGTFSFDGNGSSSYNSITMQMQQNQCGSAQVGGSPVSATPYVRKFGGCLITELAMSQQVQTMLVNESVKLQYVVLTNQSGA